MVNPVTALIVFLLLLLLLVLIFIPKYGMLHFWRKAKSDKRKILIEDSLKFIYDQQLKKKVCTKVNLGVILGMSNSSVDELIEVLVKLNLIEIENSVIKLTPEGSEYAVKVVRIHRLLEKYLAEETSIKEDYWHILAEDKEHHISDEEAESLAAQLGNPLLDPHGDPIPNKEGEQIHTVTNPLTELNEGDAGIIMHIEDEPPEIYSGIASLNLHIGTYLKVIKKYSNEIIVEGGGTTTSVPIPFAGNIFLSEPVEELITAGLCRLSELKMNEEAVIAGISKGMRGQQRRRLLDFGFVPGTRISVRLASIGNDPVAYDIRSTTVALRKQQADLVFVKKFNGGADYGRN